MRRRKNLKTWVAVCVSLLAIARPVPGRTIYVDANGLADFNNIQAAIDDANDADTVIVNPGTYTGPGNRNIDFLGKAITVRSTDPNDPNIVAGTIIDCQERGRGFYFHNNEDSNTALAGFTITRGYAAKGGAVKCSSSSPGIKNCVIKINTAHEDGGGMFNLRSSPVVINCQFLNNSTRYWWGGGIYNSNGSAPSITNCTFSNNSATWGGGISNRNNSSPVITHCVFSGNYAKQLGGGMDNSYSSPLVEKCIFFGNGAGDGGGGVYVGYASVPKMKSCIFSHNGASRGGGIGNFSGFDFTMSNCVFFANAARSRNGGGAIYNHRPLSRVENGILWENSAPEITGVASTLTFSSIKGGWPGEGNIDADPCFANPAVGDYHLLPSSPCIDAGDPNYVAGPNETDPDGNPRVMDGDGDGNSVVDMGAYEYPVTPMIEAAMKFTPQALNPGSKGNWIKAHLVVPEGYAVGDVDANRPAVVEPGGIESDYMNVFVNEDGLVEIEAAFGRAEFCSIATDAEPMEVTVVGSLTSGQQFYGTDTIKITSNYLKYLGTLASRWLQRGCGKPDWCSGLDLDQDSSVNFVDLALFDACCIEVVR